MSNTIGHRKPKAIIYTRVSTDDQAEKGFSLIDQQRKLKNYCHNEGYEIVAHYEDDHSAKNFNRPEFQKMLTNLKSKVLKADLLLTVRYDRFSRNAELSLRMISELKKYGVEFNTVEQKIDLNNPESLLMHLLYLGMPEVENRRRAENVTNGMRQAQREGRWMAKAPKGYDNVTVNGDKTIVPNDDAKYIKFAFDKLQTGLYNIEEVRKQLSEKGCKIKKSPFHRLIKNPVYIGKIRIKAWRDEPEEIVEGTFEPIIEDEIFWSVQDILEGRKSNKNKPKSSKDERLPLRGFLECPECGSSLTGSFSKGRSKTYGYYHCQSGCKARFSSKEANENFNDYLNKFEIKDEILELYYLTLNDVFNKDRQERVKEINAIDKLIESNQTKADSLFDMYVDGLVEQKDFERGKKRYESNIQDFIMQRTELEMVEKNFMKAIEYSLGLLKDLPEYYEKSPIEVKHKILGSIFPEKLLYKNKKYRTAKINKAIPLICSNINEFGEIINKKEEDFKKSSSLVVPRGITI